MFQPMCWPASKLLCIRRPPTRASSRSGTLSSDGVGSPVLPLKAPGNSIPTEYSDTRSPKARWLSGRSARGMASQAAGAGRCRRERRPSHR